MGMGRSCWPQTAGCRPPTTSRRTPRMRRRGGAGQVFGSPTACWRRRAPRAGGRSGKMGTKRNGSYSRRTMTGGDEQPRPRRRRVGPPGQLKKGDKPVPPRPAKKDEKPLPPGQQKRPRDRPGKRPLTRSSARHTSTSGTLRWVLGFMRLPPLPTPGGSAAHPARCKGGTQLSWSRCSMSTRRTHRLQNADLPLNLPSAISLQSICASRVSGANR